MPWLGTGPVAASVISLTHHGSFMPRVVSLMAKSRSIARLRRVRAFRPLIRTGTPTCNGPVVAGTAGTCPVWGFIGSSVTQIGWAVGVGTELALGGHWTAKFEYLFVDLGSFNTTFTGLGGCFGVVIGNLASCTPTVPGQGTIHSTITDNIVRVGLNYQFH